MEHEIGRRSQQLPARIRLEDLQDVLAGAESLGIVCHDDPDPDCLASSLAFAAVARSLGVDDVDLLYDGTLTHQQNQSMVRALRIDLQPYASDDVDGYDASGLVDHSTPGVNNRLPSDHVPDVIFDHHPLVDGIEARFVDHQPDAGATATILTEYVNAVAPEVNEHVATALLFGICRETLGFTRGTTRREFACARSLYPRANLDLVHRLSRSEFSDAAMDCVSTAIDNRRRRGSLVVSHVGSTSVRASVPQAADHLMKLHDVSTAVVFGLYDGAIHLSARTTDSCHVGRTMHRLFGDVGSAGGHQYMAGGRIPVGVFGDILSDGQFSRLFSRRLAPPVFDALG